MLIRSISLLLVATCFLGAEDLRTWHTITGGHFEAKLVEVHSTRVTLANEAGKTIDFPITDLRPSDQSYIRSWQQSQTEASAEAGQGVDLSAEWPDFTRKVFKDLVYLKGRRLSRYSPEPAAKPEYFAFYRSAHWCPPCRGFTPGLVDYYDMYKLKGAPFELVFISSDKSEEAMEEYMDEYDMEWPAFEYGENKDIVSRNGNGIPNLIVTDAEGNKLFDSYDESGKYIGPSYVMTQLEELLKE